MSVEKLTDNKGNTYYHAGNLCGGVTDKWIEIWKPEDAILSDGIVLLKFHQEECQRVLARLQAGYSTKIKPENIPAAIEILQAIRGQKS